MQQVQLLQRRAPAATQPSCPEKVGLAGAQLLNEVQALCQMLMITEQQWHVKLVTTEQSGELFLRVLGARLADHHQSKPGSSSAGAAKVYELSSDSEDDAEVVDLCSQEEGY